MILPTGFGLGLPHQNAIDSPGYYDRAIDQFNPPCFYNWRFDLPYEENYFRMLWRASWVEDRKEEILATPDDDKIWLLGNEPQSMWQGNETPEEFASAVRFWVENIGRPFAIPGVVWNTQGYHWWKKYLEQSAPEPGAYHIHVYASNSVEWAQFIGGALTIFNDRPLIVTECGGWGSLPDVQNEIQSQIYTTIALGQIPAAFWFSSRYGQYAEYWRATDCHDIENNESR